MTMVLNTEMFYKRTKRLYAAWKNGRTEAGEPFPNVDAIYIVVGTNNDILYCKSFSLEVWLFGNDMNDILIILAENSIHFFTSKKKVEFLRQIEYNKDENSVPSVNFHIENKLGSNQETFDELIDILKSSGNGKTLGVFMEDNFVGAFIDLCIRSLKNQNFEYVDISNAVASLFSMKEESEISLIKTASQVSVYVYQRYLKTCIMNIIDSNKKVKHFRLADEVEAALTNKKYIDNDIDIDSLFPCYSPIIQSGGNYTFGFSATSDENYLDFGIIICSLGVRYKMYCSSITRTLLVNPSNSVQELYEFLVNLQEYLLTVLKSDVKLCDVYNAGVKFTQEKRPDLIDNLTKNFGFSVGIEFCESSFTINVEETSRVQNFQVYNLCVGLERLTNEEEKNEERKHFSLFIGDIVLVNENSPATLLTKSKKLMNNVSIFTRDELDDKQTNTKKYNDEELQQLFKIKKCSVIVESTLKEPPFTYASLVFMAIEDSSKKELINKDICAWILHNFPYYQICPVNWKKNIADTLSRYKCFVKSKKSEHKVWSINPAFRKTLISKLKQSTIHQCRISTDIRKKIEVICNSVTDYAEKNETNCNNSILNSSEVINVSTENTHFMLSSSQIVDSKTEPYVPLYNLQETNSCETKSLHTKNIKRRRSLKKQPMLPESEEVIALKSELQIYKAEIQKLRNELTETQQKLLHYEPNSVQSQLKQQKKNLKSAISDQEDRKNVEDNNKLLPKNKPNKRKNVDVLVQMCVDNESEDESSLKKRKISKNQRKIIVKIPLSSLSIEDDVLELLKTCSPVDFIKFISNNTKHDASDLKATYKNTSESENCLEITSSHSESTYCLEITSNENQNNTCSELITSYTSENNNNNYLEATLKNSVSSNGCSKNNFNESNSDDCLKKLSSDNESNCLELTTTNDIINNDCLEINSNEVESGDCLKSQVTFNETGSNTCKDSKLNEKQ